MIDTQPPLAPEQIEAMIRDLATRIAKGVKICSVRYGRYLEASRELDAQYAAAYLDAEGSIPERKYRSDLSTMDARERRDTADTAYRYADRQAKALELELRALQSVGASIRAMYAVAGRGES